MQLARDSPGGRETDSGPSARRAGVLTSVLWPPRKSKHRTCTGRAGRTAQALSTAFRLASQESLRIRCERDQRLRPSDTDALPPNS